MSQEKLVVLLHRGLGPGWGLSFVPQPTHVPPLCPLAGATQALTVASSSQRGAVGAGELGLMD